METLKKNWALLLGKAGLTREYYVTGTFRFQMSACDKEPDLEQYARAAIELARIHPWYKDVFSVTIGGDTVYNSSCPVRIAWFGTVPQSGKFRFLLGVFVYKLYLCKIARELAKRRFSGVHSVTSSIANYSTTTYLVE